MELPTHHPEVQAAHQAHRTRASDAAPAACPRLASCDAGARISSLMTRPWRKRDSNPRSRLPTSTRTIQLSGCSVHGQYLVAHGVVPPICCHPHRLADGAHDRLFPPDLATATPFFVTPGMQVQQAVLPANARALAARGLQAGREISLMSCNNERSRLMGVYPSLTTIDVHSHEIGRRAVDQLAWRIRHCEYSSMEVNLEPTMVVGESVATVS